MDRRDEYLVALDSFCEQVRGDPQIIACLLSGSLAYGTVWQRSDIDLTLLVRDGAAQGAFDLSVDEQGITINLAIVEVSRFKQQMQALYGGANLHTYYGKGNFVFSKDETLVQLFEEARRLGAEDAARSSLANIHYLLVQMHRAEKWITVFCDPLYAQRFLQSCCALVADVELLRHGELPTRESILRARELSPLLMQELYEPPSTKAMSTAEVEHYLAIVDAYLLQHLAFWAGPVLRFLSDGEVKTVSHIQNYLRLQCSVALEYLAEKGKLVQVTEPGKLFKKSRVMLEEKAYYSNVE